MITGLCNLTFRMKTGDRIKVSVAKWFGMKSRENIYQNIGK